MIYQFYFMIILKTSLLFWSYFQVYYFQWFKGDIEPYTIKI